MALKSTGVTITIGILALDFEFHDMHYMYVQIIVNSYSTVLKIMVGHQTFSNQNGTMFDHIRNGRYVRPKFLKSLVHNNYNGLLK